MHELAGCRLMTADGVVEVTDFMPPRGEAADVVRIVTGVEGSVAMETVFDPRFDYGRSSGWVTIRDGQGSAVSGPDALWVRGDVPFEASDHHLAARFTVRAGERVRFVLTHRLSHQPPPQHVDPDRALRETVGYWEDWIDRCDYTGRWEDEVKRSLLFLKALTYRPTGGIVAAATTSLPEQIGGVRNWDYRYCWLRDATFSL